MVTRLQLTTIVAVTWSLWAGYLLSDGQSLPANWFKPINAVVSCVFLLLLAFEHWIWKWKLLQGWLINRPNISGTWRAIIEPVGDTESESVNCLMAIKQTYSRLSLRLLTLESKSDTVTAQILMLENGYFQVVGVYRNEPSIQHRLNSPIHNGSFVLDLVGNPPIELEGHYWTDRLTKGSIRLDNRTKKIEQSFPNSNT